MRALAPHEVLDRWGVRLLESAPSTLNPRTRSTPLNSVDFAWRYLRPSSSPRAFWGKERLFGGLAPIQDTRNRCHGILVKFFE